MKNLEPHVTFFFMVLLLLFVKEAHTQITQTLNPSNTGGQFGSATYMNDSMLFIADRYASTSNLTLADKVYYYKLQGNSWVLKQKISPPTSDLRQSFGTDIHYNSLNLIVAAPKFFSTTANFGTAYIYQLQNDTFQFRQTFSDTTLFLSQYYGSQVRLDDTHAIVSATRGNGITNNSGTVYYYKKSGNVWSQQQVLFANDGNSWDNFGSGIGLRNDKCIIGVPSVDDFGDLSMGFFNEQ